MCIVCAILKWNSGVLLNDFVPRFYLMWNRIFRTNIFCWQGDISSSRVDWQTGLILWFVWAAIKCSYLNLLRLFYLHPIHIDKKQWLAKDRQTVGSSVYFSNCTQFSSSSIWFWITSLRIWNKGWDKVFWTISMEHRTRWAVKATFQKSKHGKIYNRLKARRSKRRFRFRVKQCLT